MLRTVAGFSRWTFVALWCVAAGAFAQTPNPYNGTWKLSIDSDRRTGIEGSVEVKDDGGAWKTISHDQRDACAGREAPIAVRSASAEELVFRVMRSQVLSGCPDFTVTMKRVDEGRLEGVMRNGWTVRMTR